MASQINSGSMNNELLFLSCKHRAARIFEQTGTDDSLKVWRADRGFWDHVKTNGIPKRVMHYIRIAGFGSVFDCGYHKVDQALITGLIERWRPATHMFDLPVGEVTVTLQDIQVLWGLAVDRGVVSGVDTQMTSEELNNIFMQYLGCTPLPTSFIGNLLKLSTLLEVIKTPLPDEPSDEVVIQRARVYIMHLIGDTLCPDSFAS